MNTIKLLAVAAIALIGCGDNKSNPDARPIDARPADAYCSDCPAAPTLGMQIDRMGRAAVNTALNRSFEPPSTAQQAAKTEYNEDGSKTSWLAPARIAEFMANLAMVDALDTGICGNGRCEATETMGNCADDCGPSSTPAGNGCGNQPLFNAQTGYGRLAAVLADDELYMDSSKPNCGNYLAVEFSVVSGSGQALSCGGRGPDYDVIDFSLTMLTMGVPGFSTDGLFTPKVQDGVDKHDDLLPAFPYLGDPHEPN